MSLGIIFTPSYFCREAKVTPETTFGVSGVTLPLVPQWHGHGVPAGNRPFGKPTGLVPKIFEIKYCVFNIIACVCKFNLLV